VGLGDLLVRLDGTRRGEQKAKEHFLRSGELGYGEGFFQIARIHLQHRNWDDARLLCKKAAEKLHVMALAVLATEAMLGYFAFPGNIQEDHRRPPDVDEAFRFLLEGARLGNTECCLHLGNCYVHGCGTEKNLSEGFKWCKKAAEKGHARGMRYCADCYANGEGVERSLEQAIYWYEKSLELEDNEQVRRNLQVFFSVVPLLRCGAWEAYLPRVRRKSANQPNFAWIHPNQVN
jgi:TPR repeat protein